MQRIMIDADCRTPNATSTSSTTSRGIGSSSSSHRHITIEREAGVWRAEKDPRKDVRCIPSKQLKIKNVPLLLSPPLPHTLVSTPPDPLPANALCTGDPNVCCSVCRFSAANRANSSSCSVSGLLRTFSSVNRFRADMGGQFRMDTTSCMRSPGSMKEHRYDDPDDPGAFGNVRSFSS